MWYGQVLSVSGSSTITSVFMGFAVCSRLAGVFMHLFIYARCLYSLVVAPHMAAATDS